MNTKFDYLLIVIAILLTSCGGKDIEEPNTDPYSTSNNKNDGYGIHIVDKLADK